MTISFLSRRSVVLGLGTLGLSACGARYHTLPPADQVVVLKAERRLLLLRGNKPIREFGVGLGFAPQGHKEQEGDGRTPEGVYWIDRKNPRSQYHLSLGINYPNANDVARAESMGVEPGGDIFIHGEPTRGRRADRLDWTAGCIAVRDPEIEEIYSRVPVGTPVIIQA